MIAEARRAPREIRGWMVLAALLAFFGVVFAVNAVMVVAAVGTFGGVETASSYQAGRVFAHETAAARAQEARNWNVAVRIDTSRDGTVNLLVEARDGQGAPVAGHDARLVLAHPASRRLDREVVMIPRGAGRFSGTLGDAPGQWDLVIELSRGSERTFRSRERVVMGRAGP